MIMYSAKADIEKSKIWNFFNNFQVSLGATKKGIHCLSEEGTRDNNITDTK
jgi:hypothetical protein